MIQLIEPDSPQATLEQGFSYIKKGDLGKAISVMNELIENDPYLAQAYWGRALCFEYRAEDQDDIEQAIADYSKSIVYSAEPSALSFGRRGILYFKAGKPENALKDLDKALGSDIYWAEARFYRGRAYVSLARDENDAILAEKDFTEMINHVEMPFAPAYFWRAQARRALGRSAEAITDYETALSIDPEDVLALNALAYCNEHGIGVKPDRGVAEALYRRAAELGFVISQKNLSWFYGGDEDGNGEDAELSAYWMRKAAAAGDPEAQNLYGLRHLYGKGVRRDAYQAVYYFQLASDEDYAPAMCNLADCLEHGTGTDKDPKRAFELYKQAALSGLVLAIYQLGRCYYFGIGVEEDNDKAFSLLKPLADDGHARAQDMIGMCYENGYGVTRNIKLAGKYYKASYKQGYIHAGTHLASRYRAGRGVKKNLAAAARLYAEAGEKGSSCAWYLLGRLYYDDKYDYEKAADAFRHAIDAGEQDISVWLARSLLYSKKPQEHLDEVHRLLLKCVEEESSALHAAIFLCDLEFYGFGGYPLNPDAAIGRLMKLLPEDDGARQGLSCACCIIAQAYELGLGVPRDAKTAADYYIKAGETRETDGCRCFVAGFAHMLFHGIGCDASRKAAETVIKGELDEFGGNANSEVKLLYIWASLTSGTEQDPAPLAQMADGILREDPNNAPAAYLLWFLHRNTDDAGKYMRRLKKLLKIAPPYYRFMFERGIADNSDEPVYPVLTTGVLDSFYKQ